MVTKIDGKWMSKWHQQVIKIGVFGTKGSFFGIFMDFDWLVFLLCFWSSLEGPGPPWGYVPGLEGIASGVGSVVVADVYIYIYIYSAAGAFSPEDV